MTSLLKNVMVKGLGFALMVLPSLPSHADQSWLTLNDLKFGKFSLSSVDYRGLEFRYTDVPSGTSRLRFTATRPDSEWVFQHLETFDPSAWDETTTPVMKLDVNHVLTLYKKSDGSEVIQLDPSVGTITVNSSPVITPAAAASVYERMDISTWFTGDSLSSGAYGTAIGASTADGDYATALGHSTTVHDHGTALGTAYAWGIGATAVGYGYGNGNYATALGASYTEGDYTAAMGSSSTYADGATAMGWYSSANGVRSTAMGNSTTMYEYGSAMGVSLTYGVGATAMGFSVANYDYGTAMGSSWSDSSYTTAMGASIASFSYSTAMGNSTAIGSYSTAMGLGTQAVCQSQVVVGQYNAAYWSGSSDSWNDTDELFTVGNGTSDAQSNAFVILKNGDTTVNGNLTVNGPVCLPPQGDLGVGTFTHEPAP